MRKIRRIMNVVIVESPAKAKTINKYLGSDYTVLASYGHVRDLPPKDGSVRPDEDFAMDWQVDDRAEKPIKAIADALDGASALFLATDPDREGEAISWHIEKILRERHLLAGIPVRRVVFNEITETAVREAFSHPRDLDDDLIEAYLARRALDYLVGFTLSPVLWRKLPGSRSAGRVQSVALRLICEREAEIEVFKPQEYWSVEVALESAKGAPFTARLTHLDGAKLDRMALKDEAMASAAVAAIEAREFAVALVEKKRVKRNPQPPFNTSSLQQEASRKLGFGATQTMRVAQKLYEGIDIGGQTVGLITYMRTDSVVLSGEAVSASRRLIAKDFGDPYVPASPRIYKTKAKKAQEAHEAVRPTDFFRRPSQVAGHLDRDGARLYELIWQRTVAAEMASAELDQVAADIAAPDGQVVLRATGSTVAFDGFLRVYREGRDEPANGQAKEGDDERRLPPLVEREGVTRKAVTPEQHFTQPPPRYSEASLVRKLEEMGIGRPSTYASILQVLQDRDYVRLDKRRFVPEDRGRLVTAFLSSFFGRYVEYDFTAKLEEQLDDVSGGRIDWKAVLRAFWQAFSEAVDGTKDLTLRAVIDTLDEELGPHFFPPAEDGRDVRACPACADGRIGLKVGRHGAFIGCSNYPDCRYTWPLIVGDDDGAAADIAAGPRELGQAPDGQAVTLRKGPFGLYVQLGEGNGEEKPKRVSLPKGLEPDAIDIDTALKLLALPRDVGPHPEDGEMIQAGIGRYGPYVRHGRTYVSLPDPGEVLTVGLNRAVALIAEKPKRGGGAKALRELGNHPDDDKPVAVFEGRYGPYVKHARTNATLPKDIDPQSVTLEQALELIATRKAKGDKGTAKRKPTRAKKTPAKKPAAKKKAATKKKPANKPAAAAAAGSD